MVEEMDENGGVASGCGSNPETDLEWSVSRDVVLIII